MSLDVQDGLGRAGCPWELDFFQHGPTNLQVAYDPPAVRIRVSDQTTGANESPSEMHARLSADGTVWLGARGAPPGLLLSPTGARLVPSVPGIDEVAAMGPDDLLILYSACVLEHLPAGFSRLVAGSLPSDGRDLIAALRCLTATGAGCAVVAKRRAPGAPTKEPTT